MLARWNAGRVFCLSVLALALANPGAATQPIDRLNLPARPVGAKTGSQFKDQILNLARDVREEAIYHEVLSGNVPDFVRNLKPVTISGSVNGIPHTATFYVVPEYVSIGSDSDYFRMPMSPILAQWIADATGTCLPTRKMVSATWSAATCKLAPSPIAPSAAMVTVPVFWDHQQTVQAQRDANGAPLGALVSGDKKDVVISPQLVNYSDFARVAIFGWYYVNGTYIQPLYFGHESTYADYSHGIRLVNDSMMLDGTTVTIQDVLTSSSVGTLLNDELNSTSQPILFTGSAPPRYNVVSPPAGFPYVDSFPSTGRELGGWINRFTTPVTQAFTPASPGGDGYGIVVKDPSGGIDTTRIGSATDSDYTVQCDIYCNYRPALASDGFERVGIFARDDGNGMFCGTNVAGTIKGNNFCLTWDSKDGRVQCLDTLNGAPNDLLPAPQYRASSAWRTMRIEALGSQITFAVDGTTLLSTSDGLHPQGQFGIGYQEQFATNSNILGTYADNFRAESVASSGSKISDWDLY